MLIKKQYAVIFFFFIFVAGILSYQFIYSKAKQPSKHSLIQSGIYLLDNPRKIVDFSLLNQQGEAINQHQWKGQWQLIFFGFTHCPDICPMTLAIMKNAYSQLSTDHQSKIELVLVTVDPARDTATKLKQYIGFFGGNILGVTGDFLQLLQLTQNLSVPFKKVMQDTSYTIDHSAYLYLIDNKNQYQGFLKPPFTAETLAKKITTTIDWIEQNEHSNAR